MFDSYLDDVLHYGLLCGAVIQLIALAAVIFLPSTESPVKEEEEKQEVGVTSMKEKPPPSNKQTSLKGVRKRKK